MTDVSPQRPTKVRFMVLAIATGVALLLYLDRYCLSTSDTLIRDDLKLEESDMKDIRSAFFLTYALGQIPMGMLSDRFGVRKMLSIYMIVWSAFTGLIGAIRGYYDFVFYRLGCGLFEAGAYPACAGMIRQWSNESTKGTWSAVVSFGGRFGGTVTPLIIPALILQYGWREVMYALGVGGVAFGTFYYWFFRDRPREHPWVNDAEARLIEGAGKPADAALVKTPWLRLLTHKGLWMSSFVQFGVNFGWVFILTNLNSFLEDVYRVREVSDRAWMVFTVMVFNLPALLLGGRLTDYLTGRFGKRLGRMLPMTLPRFISAGFYVALALVVAFDSDRVVNPWLLVVLLGFMAFFSDLCLPAIWGFTLDVGKRNVGIVLGWSNMWGNFGAFFTPQAVFYVSKSQWGWPGVFWMLGGAFVLIAIVGLFIDASDPLEPDEPRLATA